MLVSLDNALKVTDRKILSGQDNVQPSLGYHWVPDGAKVSYMVELPNDFTEVKFVGVSMDSLATAQPPVVLFPYRSPI